MQPTVLAVTMVWSQMERMSRRDDAVKRPSFSIAEMMAIVVIVALDCLAIRVGGSPQSGPYLIFGGLPLQIVLVIGLFIMIRRRRRMEKPLPFLFGFEVVGWTSHLTYVAACVLAATSIDSYMVHTLDPLLGATKVRLHSAVGFISVCGLVTSCLTTPQLALALLAGWISQRWSEQSHPEPIPTHD